MSKTTEQDKATARIPLWNYYPIKIKGKVMYFGVNGNRGRVADISANTPNYSIAEQEANAALIVRAVNEHDALVAVAQTMSSIRDVIGMQPNLTNTNLLGVLNKIDRSLATLAAIRKGQR